MSMTITVGSGNPGAVLIVIPGVDLTDGEPWTLTGSAGYSSWDVRGGSGTGDGATQVSLVDPACPVNVAVTYTLTVGTTTATATTTRTYAGSNGLLSSLDGGTIVDFVWLASGGDQREPNIRLHVSDVWGSSRPPMRISPVLGAGSGALSAETTGADTRNMLAILGRPCYLMHNPANCTISGCDLPLTEIAMIVRAPNDRSPRVDVAHRRWDLSYLLSSDPEPDYRVPVSTWGDVDVAAQTFGEVTALGLTFGQVDTFDWSTV